MNNEYDVVIVGSGIAGAVTAKTLTDAGKRVIVLEAGLEAGMALGGEAAFKTYNRYLQTFYKATAKTPNSPYPNIKNAPSSDVLEVSNLDSGPSTGGYFVQKGPLAFGSDNLVGAGGTTMHWLGTALRMLPNDFKMEDVYQQGKNWPFGYDVLRPYYEMAEYEIGVAGNVDDQRLPNKGDNFFSPGYAYPMQQIPQSYLDKEMGKKAEGLTVTIGERSYTLTCCSTPQGRNGMPDTNYQFKGVRWDAKAKELKMVPRDPKVDGDYRPVGSLWDPYTGERCEGNASCVPICPVQAKYNALKTFKKAKHDNKDRLKIVAQAVAYELIIDENTKMINGIRYKKYEQGDSSTYTTHVVTGKIYVLAASAIENAKLLLASKAANSSDQVGRNLMDHLCLLTWGLFPEKVYPFRGPGSTTNIPTFRDGDFRKEHAAWILPIDNWGWGWPEFSPGTDVEEALDQGLFGKPMRDHLNKLLSRQVLLHFECEQAPDPNNRVTIDPEYKDNLGNYRPVIHYSASEYMLKAFEAAKNVWDQMVRAMNITDHTAYGHKEPDHVVYKGKGYTFRGAGHIVGTHRMGSSKEDSVVDPDMRTWDHQNLFLVGCGNMPTLGTSNPTLTMTALTFKAAEAILKQLENN